MQHSTLYPPVGLGSLPPVSSARAPLALDFLIIGGGVSGLACAIALTRAGHRVVVLEKEDINNAGTSGFYIPPNMARVLFKWGLRDHLEKCGLISHTVLLMRYETGEFLGTQVWDDAVLMETLGDILILPHYELYRVLYETAVAGGATIHHRATVALVYDTEVTLASGETLTADVVVGADGPRGTCRRLVMGANDLGNPTGVSMYASTVAEEHVSADFCRAHDHTILVALGNRKVMICYPIGTGKFSLQCYTRSDTTDGEYGDALSSDISELMVDCEPRLAEMARHASPAVHISIKDYEHSENWVCNDRKLVVIGQAAHPFPPGSIQHGAMGIEDAAVLAKLFSHLSSKDQILDFLHAFQDLRRPRVQHFHASTMKKVLVSLLEDGEEQQDRDRVIKERYKTGNSLLEKCEDSPELDEFRVTFAYDCEDEADEWYMKWGRLQERAHEHDRMGHSNDGPITVQGSAS